MPRGTQEPSFPDQDQGWKPCFLQWKRSLNHWPTGQVPSSALDKGHWTRSCQRKGFGNASDLIQVSKTLSFEAMYLDSGDQDGVPGLAVDRPGDYGQHQKVV